MAAGALAGMISGSGPTCVFLCRDAAHAATWSRVDRVAGVPSRVGRHRPGPVRGRHAPPSATTGASDGQHRQPRPGVQGVRHRPGRCSSTCRSGWTTPTGSAWSGSTAPASRRCCGCSPRPRSRTPAASRTVATCGCCRCRSSSTWRPTLTVRDVVIGDAWLPAEFAAEHEWAGDAGVRTVLDGLGMPYLGLDTPVGPMSGGERRRVALAALLVRGRDLLVLDEPTNHLDVAGVAWLAEHLLGRRGALVVVTHDRWFLDAVCDQHLGGRRPDRAGVRGRLRRLDARAGGAGPGRRPRPRPGGRTCCARRSPGCAAVHRLAPPSRGSASTPPTR